MQLPTQPSYVIDDPAHQTFRVNRAALVDPDVLARERHAIFDRGWLYAGHESELKQPGDFHTRAAVSSKAGLPFGPGRSQPRSRISASRSTPATPARWS